MTTAVTRSAGTRSRSRKNPRAPTQTAQAARTTPARWTSAIAVTGPNGRPKKSAPNSTRIVCTHSQVWLATAAGSAKWAATGCTS